MTIHTTNETCPVCGIGELSARVGEQEVIVDAVVSVVKYHYSVCNGCGSEQASPLQMKMNKLLMKRVTSMVSDINQ